MEIKIKSDELAALQLRVTQIEEAIREDEEKRKKEEEEKTEKLLARMKESEEPEPKGKGKGKAVAAAVEKTPSAEQMISPRSAERKRKEPDFSNLSAEQIRRISAEKEMFEKREKKRLKKMGKAEMKWDRDTRKWVSKAANEADFRPVHRTTAPPKMVSGKFTSEYKKQALDAKWMYYWYILKASPSGAANEDICWHEWMEKEDADLYGKLLDEAHNVFNCDLIAPAYEQVTPKLKEDGSPDLEWVRTVVAKAERESELTDEDDLKQLRARIFSWLNIPEADRWGI